MNLNTAGKKPQLAVSILLLALSLGAPSGRAKADEYYPQTGANTWGPFEVYWKGHGGLAQFGMPRTGVFPTKEGYDAQWFERAMLTYNIDNPDPYKVQLQLLGSLATANLRNTKPFQRTTSAGTGTGQYFEVTGHNVGGALLGYWESKGGLPIYGYPISEAFTERSRSDGKAYTVQYFERYRLEVHPEAAGTPYEVQLGLLGSELLDGQGGPSAFTNLGNPHSYPPGPPSSGGYPKEGHAPDYSWVAGQVAFTKIQGSCVFIRAGTESFVPQGPNWDRTKVQHGDYVVVFGHIAGTGEPFEVCPGGRPYIVERTVLNP